MNRLFRGVITSLVIGSVISVSAQKQETSFLGIDFSTHNIPLEEVIRGNPQPNGIPSIGHEGDWLDWTPPTSPPEFISQEEASLWLGEQEPVISIMLNGEAKAYPLQILTYHEIVNDSIGGIPIAITFCPLCNSAIAFDRRILLTEEHRTLQLQNNDQLIFSDLDDTLIEAYAFQNSHLPQFVTALEVTFGTSGLLYNSNLLMFDSKSSTLWSQIMGRANIGILTDARLLKYPAQIISFDEFQTSYPNALVLSRETGFNRPYGNNPYPGYDHISSPAFLFRGPTDNRLLAKERVVSIGLKEDSVAFPWNLLREVHVVNHYVADTRITVFWKDGTTSALDTTKIGNGKPIGAVGVYNRNVDETVLTFRWDGANFRDIETNSKWALTGQAIEGTLQGRQLEPISHDNTLWFAWAAFKPETRIYQLDVE
ncbi:MAG: DUF3179 domain-containing protein [Deinococcales bacterium]|nr:DUF3179 domain-containing protein [Deinococcales bacterium]